MKILNQSNNKKYISMGIYFWVIVYSFVCSFFFFFFFSIMIVQLLMELMITVSLKFLFIQRTPTKTTAFDPKDVAINMTLLLL